MSRTTESRRWVLPLPLGIPDHTYQFQTICLQKKLEQTKRHLKSHHNKNPHRAKKSPKLACRSWCRSDAFTMVVKLGASPGLMVILLDKWTKWIQMEKIDLHLYNWFMSYISNMNSSKSQIIYQLVHDLLHLFKVAWKWKSVEESLKASNSVDHSQLLHNGFCFIFYIQPMHTCSAQ